MMNRMSNPALFIKHRKRIEVAEPFSPGFSRGCAVGAPALTETNPALKRGRITCGRHLPWAEPRASLMPMMRSGDLTHKTTQTLFLTDLIIQGARSGISIFQFLFSSHQGSNPNGTEDIYTFRSF